MSMQPSKAPARPPQPLIQAATLPTLLPSTGYLISALSDPNLELQQLPDILEKSPSIAARIVSLANSAWSAPIEPITSLHKACHRMGINMIRTVGVAMAVGEPFRPTAVANFDPVRFWSSSLLAADAGLWLSQGMDLDEQQTARTAALLARLGMLWLVENYPQETTSAIALVENEDQPSLNLALRQACGVGHVDVSQQLAVHWRLPTVLCNALARQKELQLNPDEEPITILVASATQMCHALSHGLEYLPDERWLPALNIDCQTQLSTYEKLRQAAPQKRSLAEAITH